MRGATADDAGVEGKIPIITRVGDCRAAGHLHCVNWYMTP